MEWTAEVYDSEGNLVATLITEEERTNFSHHIDSLIREHGWVRWEVTTDAVG